MPDNLAEARQARDGLKGAIQAHKRDCPACGSTVRGSTVRGRARPKPCEDGRELAAEHAAAVQQVKTWFDPGPDQEMLI